MKFTRKKIEMREISCEVITQAVAEMCIQANCLIGEDIRRCLRAAALAEERTVAKEVLSTLLKNAQIAEEEMIPICQDTGMAVVFLELGQDLHLVDGDLTRAVNQGVARGYEEGYLRKSVVRDPIDRVNTGDNTPAVIHCRVVPGDGLKVTVAPKGFGSENMSALKMLKPSQGLEGVRNFIIETVSQAGPNPCPPVIVGVGVGGTMEKAALMAKEALLRPVGGANADPFWAAVETDLLRAINDLNIGPAGFGGKTSSMAPHRSSLPTPPAGPPVAVTIGCHVTRHLERVL